MKRFKIYLDTCAFDFFEHKKIDLLKELPETQLCITKQVSEELKAIPPDKIEKRAFNDAILPYIQIDVIFRFDLGPGLDQGQLPSVRIAGYHNDNSGSYVEASIKGSGLRNREADTINEAISLDWVLLTTDQASKKRAQRSGGKIGFLPEWDTAIPLKEFISSIVESEKLLD